MTQHINKPILGTPLDWADPLNQGLILYFLVNEGGGNILYDISKNSNNGTFQNIAFPADTSSGWNPANKGVGLQFDGVNDSVALSAINVGTTHSFIVVMDYQEIVDGMICGRNGLDDTKGYLLFINSTSCYYNNGGNNGTDEISVLHNGVTPGKYNQFATVRNGAKVDFYQNGVQIGTTQTSLTNTSITDIVSIGRYPSGPAHATQMRLNEIRIYNRILSGSIIRQHYINNYKAFN